MIRRRGFSLVEVLLATALLAAGIGLAFATLRSATVATERAEAAAQRNERLRAVQGFMRRQIENAMPLPIEPVDGSGQVIVFEVEADTLRLVAPMPGYLSRGGPYVQTFRLLRGVGGMRLEFTHQLLTPDGPLSPEREPEILLEGIAEARFEVRGLEADARPGAWTSRWQEPATIPRLARLRLRFEDERAAWPDLVVAPRSGQLVLTGAAGPVPGDLP